MKSGEEYRPLEGEEPTENEKLEKKYSGQATVEEMVNL